MFLIYLLIYILGSATSYNFLWKAIDYNGMFGFWRVHVVDYVYGKGHHMLAEFLGDCQICFAHFIGWLNFIPFLIFAIPAINWGTGWLLVGEIILAIWVGLVIITMAWQASIHSKSIIDKNFEAARKLKAENDKNEQQ